MKITPCEEDIQKGPLPISRDMIMDEVKWFESVEHETPLQDKGWKWYLEHKEVQF